MSATNSSRIRTFRTRNDGHEKKKTTDDTIAAIATPTGSGGIGVIRISGPSARSIIKKLFLPVHKGRLLPFRLRYGHIKNLHDNKLMDEVLVAYMPGPNSFTGEDMVEIYCHAGQIILGAILDQIFSLDSRPAEAGEFSLRRFVNRGEDLSRLEGAADIVAAKTDLAYRLSREHLLGAYGEHITGLRHDIVRLLAELEADIDFPDEDDLGGIGRDLLASRLDAIIASLEELAASYRTGRIVRDGYRVILLGPPNVGKSSLFNRLVRQNRALVTPVPGTTRDYISEWIDVDGLPVELFDTAGLRAGRGRVEKAGIETTRKLIGRADLVLYIVDINARPGPLPPLGLASGQRLVLLLNKVDICRDEKKQAAHWQAALTQEPASRVISAKTGRGLKRLLREIYKMAGLTDLTDSLVVTSHRHKTKIDKCLQHLRRVRSLADMPPEIISMELRGAADRIGEITGHIYTEEILDEIFAGFCIGK